MGQRGFACPVSPDTLGSAGLASSARCRVVEGLGDRPLHPSPAARYRLALGGRAIRGRASVSGTGAGRPPRPPAPGGEALPPVVMGSHVDSVPTGGRFDGALGVITALEAIRALDDARVATRHPIELAIFTNEEGARFQPAMLGSAVLAGKVALEDAYAQRDRSGIRLVDELERIGYLGSEPCVPRPMRAYLELHIEQGPLLDEAATAIAAHAYRVKPIRYSRRGWRAEPGVLARLRGTPGYLRAFRRALLHARPHVVHANTLRAADRPLPATARGTRVRHRREQPWPV